MLCRKCPGQGTRLSTNPSVIWPFARRRRAHEGCRLRCCRLLVAATLRDRAARPVLYDCQWPVPGLRRCVSRAACTSVVPPPPCCTSRAPADGAAAALKCGAMQAAPQPTWGFTPTIFIGGSKLTPAVAASSNCSLVVAARRCLLGRRSRSFAGGSCSVTISNPANRLCLQGNALVAPHAASDCRWQLTRLPSGDAAADVANGCAVTALQHSGEFTE